MQDKEKVLEKHPAIAKNQTGGTIMKNGIACGCAAALFLLNGGFVYTHDASWISPHNKCYSAHIKPCYRPKSGKHITIFVHGGGKPVSSFLAIPGFYTACPRGFVPYASLGSGCSTGKNIARELHCAAPDHYPLETFYVFGWSGFLSFAERRQEGRNLYKVIRQLRDDPQFEDAYIEVITHSHGGNVALNTVLGACDYNDTRVLIDRLILLACPVVVDTHEFIESPIFKEVIVLFSKSDGAQVLDLQGLAPIACRKACCAPFFSGRRFACSPRIIQAEIKCNNRSTLGHVGFTSQPFLRHMPEIVDILTNNKKRAKLTCDKYGAYCLSMNKQTGKIEPCGPKKSCCTKTCACCAKQAH